MQRCLHAVLVSSAHSTRRSDGATLWKACCRRRTCPAKTWPNIRGFGVESSRVFISVLGLAAHFRHSDINRSDDPCISTPKPSSTFPPRLGRPQLSKLSESRRGCPRGTAHGQSPAGHARPRSHAARKTGSMGLMEVTMEVTGSKSRQNL